MIVITIGDSVKQDDKQRMGPCDVEYNAETYRGEYIRSIKARENERKVSIFAIFVYNYANKGIIIQAVGGAWFLKNIQQVIEIGFLFVHTQFIVRQI